MSIFAPGISDEHYAALGRIADAWARLEQIIDLMSVALVSDDAEAGLCLTAQVIGPSRKIDALLSLLKLRGASEGLLKSARSLSGTVIELGNQRNRALHDPWSSIGVADDGYAEIFRGSGLGFKIPKKYAPHRTEITARKTLVFKDKRVETKELKELFNAIESLTMRFLDLSAKIDGENISPAVREVPKKAEPPGPALSV
ncbi:hypothetical protein [Caulobacter sp. BP25]|uniref:hypothetical protein n=1 Tax=Caulobacter sp. BP25 TaxID=2048900 RepID=UPI00117C195C|nr:hypothetical protein [Caulobacter sp. BP25]